MSNPPVPAPPREATNLIDVVAMKKYFPIRAGLLKRLVGNVRAVDDVSFYIKKGETLGLVGESGCGKTTVGRSIMMLTAPTAGYALFETPKTIVDDVKSLMIFRAKAENGDIKISEFAAAAGKISSLVSNQNCDIRAEKKKHLCSRAMKLNDTVSGKGKREISEEDREEFIELIDESIMQIAKKYSMNYRKKKEVRALRNRIQFVFQDPFSSLNPRMLIKDIIAEPLMAQKRIRTDIFSRITRKKVFDEPDGIQDKGAKFRSAEEIRNEVILLLEKVGLNIEHLYRYPHEFSGGQRQRIGIARALSVQPDFVVLDEPTSALDVSVQAQILNMLNDLQRDFGLTFLFISHDLSTIRYMCDRIAVMYLGKIVEAAPKAELFRYPTHPYTEALLSVIPVPDPDLRRDRIILAGDVPSPANPPSGCRFHTRCPLVVPICSKEEPLLIDLGNEHFIACHVRKEIVKSR